MGPSAFYQQCLAEGSVIPDAAQASAVKLLQALYDRYVAGDAQRAVRTHRKRGLFAWLSTRDDPNDPESQTHQQGIYFWGGVGRGKTWLMDMFYECLPEGHKKRLHFHRFMGFVQQQLKVHQGSSDPLEKIAGEFAAANRILCFDEFFVSDITDAMLLSGLLDALFRRGVILVATSNVPPDRLYWNGLQRSKFLPAIDLLKFHTQVVNLDGGVDYRLRALEAAELYHCPLDQAADQSLLRSFNAISPDTGKPEVALLIEGRPIKSRYAGDGVVWFDFNELCGGPRSQLDYMEIARLYQTVLISGVPAMTNNHNDEARRFISLVDEFYDRSVKLILSAAVPVTGLYSGQRLEFEFERTLSRLQEMMSHDYLSREHKP
ncbi:MAG: cell division protein ZapE [Gammaproteobacteria bacterium]|nr:cell division protein ZapE [Gammaproteobacteria bacterium]